MYTIFERKFKTFHEVISWAWNEHKIEFCKDSTSEEDRQEACRELEKFITRLDEHNLSKHFSNGGVS